MQIVDAHPDRSAQSEHDLEQLYQTFKNTEDQLTAMSEAK
jgi:hypothetical protein